MEKKKVKSEDQLTINHHIAVQSQLFHSDCFFTEVL
jgi:hypothetical protein